MVLPVVKFGTPVLRQKGARIEAITPAIKTIAPIRFVFCGTSCFIYSRDVSVREWLHRIFSLLSWLDADAAVVFQNGKMHFLDTSAACGAQGCVQFVVRQFFALHYIREQFAIVN